MRWRNAVVVALAGFALSSIARGAGGEDDAFTGLDPQTLFQGTIHESDVALLFDYLRRAFTAAAEGREAPAPEELQKRAEALGNELKTRGTLAALLILSELEARAKQGVREGMAPRPPALPPVTPFAPTAAH